MGLICGLHVLRPGVCSGFEVVRYHSLAVDEASLPACLQPIAWTCGTTHALERGDDPPGQSSASGAGEGLPTQSSGSQVPRRIASNGTAHGAVLMAVAHRDRPHYGVQFHPESIATKFGAALFHNFRRLVDAHHGRPALPAPELSPGALNRNQHEPSQEIAPSILSWRNFICHGRTGTANLIRALCNGFPFSKNIFSFCRTTWVQPSASAVGWGGPSCAATSGVAVASGTAERSRRQRASLLWSIRQPHPAGHLLAGQVCQAQP